MTLKSLKSMTKKKAERLNLNRAAPELDNTRRRQLNQAKKKSLYGESADSWRIMDPLNVEGCDGWAWGKPLQGSGASDLLAR